jgi:tetratricopeptide (TPR) repeat protein
MFSVRHWQHYLRGRVFERLNWLEAALAEYGLALSAAPAFTRAASALGALHARRGHLAEAERWLEKAARTDPRNAGLLFNLGYVRDKLRQPERAIEAFARAVRLDPKHDRAWYGMGLCHAALGRHEEGAKALEEAGALQPENPVVWYQLGMAYHALGQRDKVKEVIGHMFRFNPMMTRQLIRDTDFSELTYLVKDLIE